MVIVVEIWMFWLYFDIYDDYEAIVEKYQLF